MTTLQCSTCVVHFWFLADRHATMIGYCHDIVIGLSIRLSVTLSTVAK